jgi:hypothetical protein
LCAEHVRQLEGESLFDNLMEEVIAKRKGVVARRGLKEAWSKRREPMYKNPNQKHEGRTIGQMIAKSISIRA